MQNCKNCQKKYDEGDRFCSACGQNVNIRRIDFRYLVEEVQQIIFNFDGGLFFTIKELFTRPGYAIKEYIIGKRQRFTKPILFLMIVGALYSFVRKWLELNTALFQVNHSDKTEEYDVGGKAIQVLSDYIGKLDIWIDDNYALFVLFQIPIIAFGFHLGFKKFQRYNYTEWLVIMVFIAGQFLIFSTLGLFYKVLIGRSALVSVSLFLLLLWTIVQLFSDKKKIVVLWRFILSGLISVLFWLVFLIISVAFFGSYILTNHNEVMELFKS